MEDVMEKVKSLENFGLLLKGVCKQFKIKQKKKKKIS